MLRLAGPRSRSLDIRVPTTRIAVCRSAGKTPPISSTSGNVLQTTRFKPHASAPSLFHKIKAHITSLHSNGPSNTEVDVLLINKTVNELHLSLKERDLRAAWRHWSLLDQRGLLEFLGPSQLDRLSRAIVDIYNARREYDDIELRTMEEIALVAAAGNAADALNELMLSHIRKGNPDAVLELDRRLTQLLDEKGNWMGEELEEGDEVALDPSYSVLAPMANPKQGHVNLKNANIQLAVTTAFAMKDSFEGALNAFLKTNLRLAFALKGFLKNLTHDPPLRQKVEDYARRLGVAKLVLRQPSFVKHITNLSRDQAVVHLEKLYDTVINGMSGPNAYLAAHSGAVDSKKVVLVSEIAWTAFLSAFMKCQRIDLAEKLWDDMLRLGIRPGTSIWTALFDCYGSIGAVKEVLDGWDNMLSGGVKPDALTYRALISALFNGKRPDEALKRFKAFEKLKPSPTWDSSHILSVYNTVLHGLLDVSRETEALTFLQAMRDSGPKPDLISYNTILGYYGRRGDFKTVAAYVREMASCGLVGDVFTFSTILSALLKVGREDAPEMMVNFMEKQGVEPNVATYSAIIDQQMREQTEDNFRGALRLLQHMEQDPRTQPNQVTYTAILAGMYRGQWLDPRVAEEYRQDIVQRMQSRGIRPNKVTYHILLKACLEYPEPEGLQNALRYHREMASRRIPISQDTWYIILRGLTDRGEWEIAGEMMKEMLYSNIHPTGALSDLVSRIRKRTRKAQP